MRLKINDMNKDLKFGRKGEIIIKKKIDKLFEIILLPYIKQYFFENNSKEQLEGKDISIPKIDIEVKTRRYHYRFYNDILLEKRTGNKQGWFFTTKSKFVSYGFFNKEETDYLKNKAWILNIKKCREYFTLTKLSNYEIKIASSGLWDTDNYVVPISEFPKTCLISFPNKYWDNCNGLKKWINGVN